MLVILNPRAAGGTAQRKWARIEADFKQRLGNYQLLILDDFEDAEKRISEELSKGERRFVAAGGDGTANFLLNTIMALASPELFREIAIGAVGLGSSNDLHKPFDQARQIEGVPCRIDFPAAPPHDIGIVEYPDIDGNRHTRYWLINASVGITAEANRLFNSPGSILGFLKRSSTGLAILYSALVTLLRFKAMKVQLGLDGEEVRAVDIENLGVVKNPHFSGNFRYDSPHEIDSGRFYVHIVEKRSLPSKLHLLYLLSKSSTERRGLTLCRQAECVTLSSERPYAVEFDGEITVTNEVRFIIRKKAIKVAL